MLEVIAINYNGIAPVLPISARLPAEGGTIGRDADNTVVLPDPLRVLSRRHLAVMREGNGDYRVSNISGSNPVLLNDRTLSPGEAHALDDGDRIGVGCYLLEVRKLPQGADPTPVAPSTIAPAIAADGAALNTTTVATVSGAAAPAERPPLAERDDVGLAADDALLRDLFGEAEQLLAEADLLLAKAPPDVDTLTDVDSILSASAVRRSIGDHPLTLPPGQGVELADLVGDSGHLLRGMDDADLAARLFEDPLMQGGNGLLEHNSVDPLKIFGGAAEEALDLFGERSGGLGGVGSHAINHRVELNTPFTLPVAPGAPVSAEGAVTGAEVRPVQACDAATALIPDDFALEDLLCAASPVVEGAPVTDDACAAGDVGPMPDVPATPDVAKVSDLSAALGSERDEAVPEDVAAMAQLPEGDEAAMLYEALLEGLGLERLPDRRALDAAFMRTLGSLLRTGVEGAVQLMLARATVKREVRANVTLIGPKRNNPLKFSPDGGVALMYLLGSGYPGFMKPEEAMQEAFADLYSHQLGVVSGMRSALDHVLEHFDPETISHNASAGGMIESLLSLGRKAKLWDAYGRYFENAREQAADRFHEFFGAAFVDAYEESARVPQRKREDQ